MLNVWLTVDKLLTSVAVLWAWKGSKEASWTWTHHSVGWSTVLCVQDGRPSGNFGLVTSNQTLGEKEKKKQLLLGLLQRPCGETNRGWRLSPARRPSTTPAERWQTPTGKRLTEPGPEANLLATFSTQREAKGIMLTRSRWRQQHPDPLKAVACLVHSYRRFSGTKVGLADLCLSISANSRHKQIVQDVTTATLRGSSVDSHPIVNVRISLDVSELGLKQNCVQILTVKTPLKYIVASRTSHAIDVMYGKANLFYLPTKAPTK